MIDGEESTSDQLASVYVANTTALADALVKLASDKKFNSAADDFYSYTKSYNVLSDITGYGNVKENLISLKTITSAALRVASSVYYDLNQMKDLAAQYNGTNEVLLSVFV